MWGGSDDAESIVTIQRALDLGVTLIDTAPVPLETVIVDDPSIAPIYEAKVVLVRPDTHVAWRGNACADGRAVWRKVLQSVIPTRADHIRA